MDKVDELRNKLKEDAKAARTANSLTESDGPPVSAASADIERYTPNISNTDGHSIQPVSRPGLGTISVSRAVSNAQRKSPNFSGGASPGNSPERRTNGRSGEDNSQNWSNGTDLSTGAQRSISSTEQIRKVGNLETADPIPPRFFDAEREAAIEKSEAQGTPSTRKRGRPPKQRIGGDVQNATEDISGTHLDKDQFDQLQRKAFFNTGKILSKAEAKELAEPLIAALKDEMEQADRLLWKYTGDPLEQPIWSDVTDKEMESLTNILLKIGQKSPVVATVARTAIDASDYIVAAGVIGPRFMKTVDVIRTVRKTKQRENPNRQSRFQRLRERHQQIASHSV